MIELPDKPTKDQIIAALEILKAALTQETTPVAVTARPVFYTVDQLVEMGLGKRSAIYRLMTTSELAYSQAPGGRVVRAEDLDAYLRSVRSA